MTLKEIAAQANVSISTVSRVLNTDYPNAAGQQVRKRIWEIAQKGGYVPNKEAQALKKAAKSASKEEIRSIYCLVACSPEEVRDDPFFTQAIASVEREALQNRYVLEYAFCAGDGGASILNRMWDISGDRLIIIGRFEQEWYRQLARHFKKIVYLGWNDLDIKCDGVICDGFLAAQEAVRYLYGLGHRKIGFVGAEKQEARHRGYLEALKALGLERNGKNIATSAVLSFEGGYRGVERLLNQGTDATAIYCANDTTAIGALRACKDRALRVPEDISIMGSNDIETLQYVSPLLTTIHIPLDEMGKIATRILIDRINGGHTLPLKITVPFHIVRRESCAPPPKK